MKIIIKFLLLVVSCSITWSGLLQASPVTFNFTGTVTYSIATPYVPWASPVDIGSNISGSISYESTLVGSPSGWLDSTYYTPSDFLIADIGNNHIEMTNIPEDMQSYVIYISNNPADLAGADRLTASVDRFYDYYLRVEFTDPSGNVFSDISLPSQPIDINQFSIGEWWLYAPSSTYFFDAKSELIASGVLDVAAVPIPAAIWLFGSGLLGLVGVVRRKKSA